MDAGLPTASLVPGIGLSVKCHRPLLFNALFGLPRRLFSYTRFNMCRDIRFGVVEIGAVPERP